VYFYSDVSRWVTCYVVASPLWHVVIGSLVDYSFVLWNFHFDWKIPCTVYVLWWDYSQLTVVVILSSVVCDILFKDISSCSVIWSPSMNSAGRPHFHVPCPACVLLWLSRSGTATLFVNVFTLFTIVNIAAEETSVEYAKVVLHTSCINDWRPVRACL